MCSWAVKTVRRVIKKLLNDAKSFQKEWVCSVKRVIWTTTANILIESTHSRLAAQTSFLIVLISPDNFISHNLFLLNIAVFTRFLLSTHVIIYLESHLLWQHNAISLFPQTFLLNNAILISKREKNHFHRFRQFVFSIIMNPRTVVVDEILEWNNLQRFYYTRLHLTERSDLWRKIAMKMKTLLH